MQKEIDKLNGDISEKAFNREMEQKKADILAQKELDIKRIDEIDTYESQKAERRINSISKAYADKMSGSSIASEIYTA